MDSDHTSTTIFDQDEYSAQVGDYPEADDASWTSVTTTSTMPEAHPRYVPPHRRHARLDMGDQVVVEARDPSKPDNHGVLNRHFEKLLVYVHFALTRPIINALVKRFPAMHFASDDHRNHDHPVSHVVTQVGTRLMQRMFPSGASILDVYGNPKAAERFNASQSKSKNPKMMMALVNKFCSADFIREANKWGPVVDPDGARYMVGKISDLTTEEINPFTHLQFNHVLYYLKPMDILTLLHKKTNGKLVALGLIHRHRSSKGQLNEGEQEYEVRRGIVKQRNVHSNTCYFHPNVTPFWFRETKVWYEDENLGFDSGLTRGFAWECHKVDDDTWIVEIVPCDRRELDDSSAAMWELAFSSDADHELATLVGSPGPSEPITIIPTNDGRFVKLSVTCYPLFEHLRRQAAGRSRIGSEGKKLFDSLFATAKHLNAPGELFPGKEGMPCDPGLLVDHVLSAWVTDVSREKNLLNAIEGLRPLLASHAEAARGGMNLRKANFGSIVDAFRASVKFGIVANKVVRSSDVVGGVLHHLDEALDHD